jgi:hypothetical protein
MSFLPDRAIKLTQPRVSVLIDNPRMYGTSQPMQAEVEGLLDTGATLVVIPLEMSMRLGLSRIGRRDIRTPSGQHRGNIYGGIITIPAFQRVLEVEIASIIGPTGNGPDAVPLVLLGKSFLRYFNFCMYGPEGTFSLAVP